MKEWWSSVDLAHAKLPVLSTIPAHIRRRALRHGWTHRPRQGRGGGIEIHISSLPEPARDELARRSSIESMKQGGEEASRLAHNQETAGSTPAPATFAAAAARLTTADAHFTGATAAADPEIVNARREALWLSYERAPRGVREEADRRAKILRMVVAEVAAGTRRGAAVEAVARKCGVGVTTIRRWFAAVRDHDRIDWPAALAPRWNAGEREHIYHERLYELFCQLYLRKERPSFDRCHEDAVHALTGMGEEPGKIPTVSTLRRRLKREYTREQIVLARIGQHALKRLYPALRRDKSVFRALEAINADGHVWEIYVRWPDATVARAVMVAFQDLLTAKILSWRIDLSETKESVRLAFYDVARKFGLPDHVYLDNGRAFASKWITGGAPNRYRFKVRDEDPRGIFTSLIGEHGIHWATPAWGQAKPIERAFRDFKHRIAKHPAFAGAYSAKHPVDLATFITVIEQEVALHNARRGRRSPVCRGRSFDEVFNESYAIGPVRRASQAQLRMCMLAAENVLVSRLEGAIEIFGNRYASEMVAQLAGTRVVARFDPDDLKAGVEVYTLSGEYVGPAECLAPVGYNDVQEARRHSRARNDFIKRTKQALDAERRLDMTDIGAAAMNGAAKRLAVIADAPPDSRLVRMFRTPEFARAAMRPPIEHADRSEVEALFEQIAPDLARRRHTYDETADIEATVARYAALMSAPREQWTGDDSQFVELATPLPEIRARFGRRAAGGRT